MKLFQNLFGKGSIEVGAPVAGKCMPIKEVSDPTFGEEILGKGIAMIPSENKFYAPADGTVTTVFPTGHAVAVTSEDGVEILIHVGLDTVKLDGKYYTKYVTENQKVLKGDLLIEADLEQIKAEGYDIITPVVICNSDEFAEIELLTNKDVTNGETVMRLKK